MSKKELSNVVPASTERDRDRQKDRERDRKTETDRQTKRIVTWAFSINWASISAESGVQAPTAIMCAPGLTLADMRIGRVAKVTVTIRSASSTHWGTSSQTFNVFSGSHPEA